MSKIPITNKLIPNRISPLSSLKGTISIPGDKSISHRSIMFGAIANGLTKVTGFLDGADCRSTIECFRRMGVEIDHSFGSDTVLVHGNGLHGLKESETTLDVGNSGTTTRLISGILSGQNFTSRLNGDESIQSRPMKRIMDPLTQMGADIKSEYNNGCAPLIIIPSILHGIHYNSPVASAQVKSCILLAGLYADDETSVTEPALSRDHTERMLRAFGADIHTNQLTASIKPNPTLTGQEIKVPGDISSAAYFLAAGLIVPNSEITLRNVNINPTRAGIITVIKDMGGKIEFSNERLVSGEPVADLTVSSSSLHGTVIEGDIIPTLIDEIPIIAVLAAFASGKTIIRDAAELKVKESNRIDTVCQNLSLMGADISPTEDGMIIRGGKSLHGAFIKTHADHRIAMSFAIAGLAADSDLTLDHPECVSISYPSFYDTIEKLKA